MPVKGWLSVRDLPTTKEKSIKEVMSDFQKHYELCSCCDGKGYTVNNYDEFFTGVSTVKFNDNEDLLKLHGEGHLASDKIKQIIEVMVHNRKQCDDCKGFGFIKKTKETVKSRKKKNVKRKR